MDQIEIGKFIAKCRKEKKLTQAQLAEKLNITDRAVSKWETGKSMPDSSIMLELCEILGITVNELLSGKEMDLETYEKKADENLVALKRKDESNMKKNMVISILFSVTFLVGIMVCLICNFAISGNFTWSFIPVSSMVFAWAILFPGMILGKKGMVVSLLAFTVLIVPYLFLLSNFIRIKEVFSVGAAIAVVSILFLWMIVVVFSRIGKARKPIALGITFLLAIPFMLIINVVLSKMMAEPFLDVWDLFSILILLIMASVSFLCGAAKKKEL